MKRIVSQSSQGRTLRINLFIGNILIGSFADLPFYYNIEFVIPLLIVPTSVGSSCPSSSKAASM
jgi:hypothetical protein